VAWSFGWCESSGRCLWLAQLAGYVCGYLSGVFHKLRFQIDPALVGQHDDRPQAVRQFVTQFGLAVIDTSNTGVCLDKFRQITNIAYETERKLFGRPDAPILLGLKLFVKLV
jgi:hypothetical protein